MTVTPVMMTNLTLSDVNPITTSIRPNGTGVALVSLKRHIKLNPSPVTGWAGFIETEVTLGMEFDSAEMVEGFRQFVEGGTEFRLIEIEPLGSMRLVREDDRYWNVRHPS